MGSQQEKRKFAYNSILVLLFCGVTLASGGEAPSMLWWTLVTDEIRSDGYFPSTKKRNEWYTVPHPDRFASRWELP